MLKKLAKILPYFLVVKFVKKFSCNFIHTTELGVCNGFRIDKGEWVLFSKDNYNKMRANELKHQETIKDKKRRKLEKQFSKDYELKQQAKEIFRDEEEREREEREYD